MYVADDGEPHAHDKLHDEEWDFELTVLDLSFNAGLGRKRFVEASDEEFLLVVDSDHEVPKNYMTLKHVLDRYPEIAGVAGITMENGSIGGMCHDITVQDGVILRHAPKKNYEWDSGHSILRFDFIPNAALFRRKYVEEYMCDAQYVIVKEHLDFYFGHYLKTDREFATCPEVEFPYHETTDEELLKFRLSEKREMKINRYFLDKWGLEQILRERYWLDGTPHANPLAIRISNYLLITLAKYVLNVNDWYRVEKGRLATKRNG